MSARVVLTISASGSASVSAANQAAGSRLRDAEPDESVFARDDFLGGRRRAAGGGARANPRLAKLPPQRQRGNPQRRARTRRYSRHLSKPAGYHHPAVRARRLGFGIWLIHKCIYSGADFAKGRGGAGLDAWERGRPRPQIRAPPRVFARIRIYRISLRPSPRFSPQPKIPPIRIRASARILKKRAGKILKIP